MASISTSLYSKYVELQNVSASGDPTSAPEGGIYLFASGTSDAPNTARLYLQNEAGVVTDVVKSLDIDAFDALGGTGLHQTQDHFIFSDNGTEKKITFSNLEDAIFSSMNGASSDVAVAAGGAITLEDDSVDSAEIADGAIDTAHIADDQVTNAKLANITRGSVKVGGASNAPTDLDAKTSGQILVGDGTDVVSVAVSGDVSLAANGAVTIAANAVEGSMLNSNVAGSGLDYGSNELSVDVSDFMSSGANNRILTATGTDAFQGEANLTFDGSTLAVVGAVSGSSTLHAVGAITGGSTLAVSGAATLQAVSATTATLSGKLSSSAGADFAEAATFSSTIAASGTIQAGSHLIAGGNSIVDGGSNSVITFDGSGGTAVVNGLSVAGGYGSTGVTISPAGAIQANGGATIDGALSVGGGYGSTGATISAAGALQLNSGLTVDDAATFGGGYGSTGVTISNAGNIQANGDMTLDGAMTFGGGYGSSGVTISSAGAIQADGALTVGSDGSGVDAKFFGGDANEYMEYDASHNHLSFQNASDALILELGASSNGYALEVANLAGDAGKVKAVAFVTYSDENLKEEVTAMDNALNAVMSLNGVEFTWKNSGERDFGFLAQEVKNVLPQAVSVGNDGIHGVDYSRLTSVLVEAVKAQQVQIEELKSLLKK